MQGCTRIRGEGHLPLPRGLSARLGFGEQAVPGNASIFESSQHLVLRAAGEAVEQDTAVLRLADVKVRGVVVIVSGTEGPVLAPGIGTSVDLQHARKRPHARLP